VKNIKYNLSNSPINKLNSHGNLQSVLLAASLLSVSGSGRGIVPECCLFSYFSASYIYTYVYTYMYLEMCFIEVQILYILKRNLNKIFWVHSIYTLKTVLQSILKKFSLKKIIFMLKLILGLISIRFPSSHSHVK